MTQRLSLALTSGTIALGAALFFLMMPACGSGGSSKEPEEAAAKAEDERVLARYAGQNITVSEFERELDRLPPRIKPLMNSPERRKQHLERYILSELLVQEGKRRELDRNPQIMRMIAATEKRLIGQKLLEEIEKEITVDESDVKAYFEENKDRFVTQRLRASQIVVPDKETADKVAAEARAGADFAKLAAKYSTDEETKTKGGDLGFFGRGKLPPSLERRVFRLRNTGDISDPIRTPSGWYVIMLTERDNKAPRSYESVKAQIERQLRTKLKREHRKEYIESLQAEANIEIDNDILEEIRAAGGASIDATARTGYEPQRQVPMHPATRPTPPSEAEQK